MIRLPNTYQLRKRVGKNSRYKPLYLHNVNKNTRVAIYNIPYMIDYIVQYDSNIAVQPYMVDETGSYEYEIIKEFTYENEEQLRNEFIEYLI